MRDPGKVIIVREVAKAYRKGGQVVMALDGVSLEAEATGMVAIVGQSGSGKSTLLHVDWCLPHRCDALAGDWVDQLR